MAGFIDTLLGYKGEHPKDVARAWAEMEKQIKQEEGAVEDQQWQDRFAAGQAAGYSPGQMFDPQTGQGGQMPGMAPVDRWKSQIDAMVQSGNPVLQKKGLEMIAQYQGRATAPTSKGDADPTSYREWQLAKKNGYEGSYVDWKLLNKTAGTTVNVGGDEKFKSSDVVFDGQGNRVNVPVGMLKSNAPADWTYGQQATSEEAQQAATTQSSIDNLNRIREIVVARGGEIAGIEGWIAKARSGGGFLPVAFNAVLDAVGKEMTPEQVEAVSVTTTLGNQLLDAIRGAQVGPQEQAIFERQLPMPGQPQHTFIANMITTQRNLEMLARMKADIRGTKPPSFEGNFDQFTYGGFDYKIQPDGTVYKRKRGE